MTASIPRLSLVAVAIAALFLFAGAAPRIVDDTFITIQYAQNLVQHGQLTWHHALPPVDGFTSLAHVLVLSAGHWTGMGLIGWNSVLNIGCAALILVMFAWATRGLSLWATAAGLAVIAANAALLSWTGAGLDAVPYAAVFFAVYLSYERALREGRLALETALLLCLLAVTRPEGIFVALVLLATFWGVTAWRARSGKPARALGRSLGATGLVLGGLALLVAWRVLEFGHPLPNTYYAKASESRLLEIRAGVGYLNAWVWAGSGLLAVFSAVALALGSRAYLRALFVIGQLALVVLAGGDPHPAFRFFLPVLPLVALDIAWLIDRQRSAVLGIAVALLALVITRQVDTTGGRPTLPDPVAGFTNAVQGHWPLDGIGDDPKSEVRAEAARELGMLLPPDVPLAASDVGVLAYFSGLPILDTHGLNHPEISHLPKPEGQANDWGNFRLDYLMDRGVPLIHLSFPGHRTWSFEEVSTTARHCDVPAARLSRIVGVFEDALAESYQCLSIPSQSQGGRWLNLFLHKDRGDLLEALPPGTVVTDCIRRFRQMCHPLG